MKTNNGFPAGTCGGCGAADHYRKDCPLNPNKGKPFPKAKAKAKASFKRRAGAVEDQDADDHDDDEQKEDEGGSVWDDVSSDDGAWAVDDAEIKINTGARFFIPTSDSDDDEDEDDDDEGEVEIDEDNTHSNIALPKDVDQDFISPLSPPPTRQNMEPSLTHGVGAALTRSMASSRSMATWPRSIRPRASWTSMQRHRCRQ